MATMSSRRQGTGNARLREALVGYGFVLIPMAVFLTFFIYPFFYALYISRFDWGVFGKIETLGLENYRTLLARRPVLEGSSRTRFSTPRPSSRFRWRWA